MANRMKEDERTERIIRGLLKLPENRRCINCNSLGPQYVCTTFWTFVCTNCSGIHREFTHRIKSVSMAKFTTEEVSALQAAGNERARQIYFKVWDPQRHSIPDSSNLHRLRDFIKHVYVDRKYTGERTICTLPRLKVGDKEDSCGNRKVGTYRGGSRSPHYEDTYERRYSERSSPGRRNDDKNLKQCFDERRSPRYSQENVRYGGFRKSTFRFEVVDDRVRDYGFGNGRQSESQRFSNGESKLVSRSPDCRKNMDMSSPPVVRPVRDILGENVPPLQIGELPKANDGRDADGSAHIQKIASSGSVGSVNGNSVALKRVDSGSLIDFSTDHEPPDAAVVPQKQRTPLSIDGGNLSSFEYSAKVSNSPNANSLESLLSQLSAPAVAPVGNVSEAPSSGDAPSTAPEINMLTLPTAGGSPDAPVGHMSALPNIVGAYITASTTNVATLPPNGGAPAAVPVGMMPVLPNSSDDPMVKVTGIHQLPHFQQHHLSASPAADSSSTAQLTTSSVGALNNQPWNPSLAPNAQGPFSDFDVQSSHSVSKPVQDTNSGVGSQPLPVEAKSSERKELPADLFAASYSSVPAPVPHWQTGPPHGQGFGMQYHPTAMHVPAFLNPAKSTNPFDFNDETTQVQAPTFPSMGSLQGALPDGSAPTGLSHTFNLGTHSPRLMLPQSPSYASTMPPQSSSYASAMSPSAYMGQQLPNNMTPPRLQGSGTFGSGPVFGSLNTNQQLNGRYSAPTTPNSFSSMGGNPFG